MSDNLRSRIAAALMTADSTDAERYELADAVIAELGLRQERVELLTRYVTDWSQDG